MTSPRTAGQRQSQVSCEVGLLQSWFFPCWPQQRDESFPLCLFFVTTPTPTTSHKEVSQCRTSLEQQPPSVSAECFSRLFHPLVIIPSLPPASQSPSAHRSAQELAPGKWGPVLNVSPTKRPFVPAGRSTQATLSSLSHTDRGFRKCQLS